MLGSDGFSAAQRFAIDKAIRDAETRSRYEFSVYVGTGEGNPRVFAERLHASLSAPARSVLVAVDPSSRWIEVVTGSAVRRDLDNAGARLVVAAMQADFAVGDLVGGIIRAVGMLADRCHKPPVLHADQP
ncbi:MAG: DUF5130 domain-containing protein [Actinomycetota bacterium]|nr:DUF5130 domain-containing protein [Actinomycetota bacterium]